jgi:NADPH:quinone reductase-like Zn-dependent oxidoreductase
VELILDPIGGRHLKLGYELLAHTGRIVSCGVSSLAPGLARRWLSAARSVMRWPRFGLLRMMQKNRGIMGVHIGHLWHRRDVLRAVFGELLPLLDDGTLKPLVDATFPLERAAEAHRYIQERRNRGKVVLTVA